MSQPTTEVVTITLKPDIDLETGEVAHAFHCALEIVAEQPGFLGQYFGLRVEDSNVLSWLVNWDDISSRVTFEKAHVHENFRQHVSKIVNHSYFHHSYPKPNPPAVLSTAPVIEFATFYSIQEGFGENIQKFIEVIEKGASDGVVEGFHGIVVAETLEEIAKGGSQAGKGKGRGLHLWIGWDSVRAHEKFTGTKLFQDNVHLFIGKNGGFEIFHASYKSV